MRKTNRATAKPPKATLIRVLFFFQGIIFCNLMSILTMYFKRTIRFNEEGEKASSKNPRSASHIIDQFKHSPKANEQEKPTEPQRYLRFRYYIEGVIIAL